MEPITADLRTVEDYLRMMTHFPPPSAAIERFVLDNGQVCHAQPLPRQYRKRKAGQCFMNSYRVLSTPGLRYVEGFAHRDIIPFHHAWCIDAEDRVIDATWDNPEACSYYGVVMPTDWYLAQTWSLGYYGILDSGNGGPNLPVMMDYLRQLGKPVPDWLAEWADKYAARKRRRSAES